MSKMVKNNAKGLAVVLTAAMVLSATAIPSSDAKAKKPKLSTTKVSVEVGAKKKVTVKNAKKVTWTLAKKAKKVVSLSKKSKKGATIKGKAVGTAKITVKMKYGKKTLTKKITVSVTKKTDTNNNNNNNNTNNNNATPTPTPPSGNGGTATATPTPEAPTEEPTVTPEPTATPKPGYTKLEVDLTTAVDTEGEAIPYDPETGTLSIKDTSIFRVDCPEPLPEGSIMDVTISGCLNEDPEEGRGFRAYFIQDNQDFNISPEIANSEEDGVPIGQPFEWTFTLEVNEDCEATQLQFKGIDYQTPIEDLTVSKIVLEYKNADTAQ